MLHASDDPGTDRLNLLGIQRVDPAITWNLVTSEDWWAVSRNAREFLLSSPWTAATTAADPVRQEAEELARQHGRDTGAVIAALLSRVATTEALLARVLKLPQWKACLYLHAAVIGRGCEEDQVRAWAAAAYQAGREEDGADQEPQLMVPRQIPAPLGQQPGLPGQQPHQPPPQPGQPPVPPGQQVQPPFQSGQPLPGQAGQPARPDADVQERGEWKRRVITKAGRNIGFWEAVLGELEEKGDYRGMDMLANQIIFENDPNAPIVKACDEVWRLGKSGLTDAAAVAREALMCVSGKMLRAEINARVPMWMVCLVLQTQLGALRVTNFADYIAQLVVCEMESPQIPGKQEVMERVCKALDHLHDRMRALELSRPSINPTQFDLKNLITPDLRDRAHAMEAAKRAMDGGPLYVALEGSYWLMMAQALAGIADALQCHEHEGMKRAHKLVQDRISDLAVVKDSGGTLQRVVSIVNEREIGELPTEKARDAARVELKGRVKAAPEENHLVAHPLRPTYVLRSKRAGAAPSTPRSGNLKCFACDGNHGVLSCTDVEKKKAWVEKNPKSYESIIAKSGKPRYEERVCVRSFSQLMGDKQVNDMTLEGLLADISKILGRDRVPISNVEVTRHNSMKHHFMDGEGERVSDKTQVDTKHVTVVPPPVRAWGDWSMPVEPEKRAGGEWRRTEKPTRSALKTGATSRKADGTALEWVDAAISVNQRTKHRKILYDFEESVGGDMTKWDAQNVLEFVNARAVGRGLLWTSTDTLMGETIGAFQRADQYGFTVLKLKEDSIFRDALKYVGKKAKESAGEGPRAATFQEVQKSVQEALRQGQTQVALALILSWTTAARVGCVTQLEVRDLQFEQTHLRVTFRRGKSVTIRGPYTVHTDVGPWMKELQKLLPPSGRLFPDLTTISARKQFGSRVKESLRKDVARDGMNQLLEQRSLRRGALQTMANAGVAEDVLLTFSGHKDVKMLWRYLGWGIHRGAMHAKATLAAAALFNSASPPLGPVAGTH